MLNRILSVLLGNATLAFSLTKNQIIMYSLLIAVVVGLCTVIIIMLVKRNKAEKAAKNDELQTADVVDTVEPTATQELVETTAEPATETVEEEPQPQLVEEELVVVEEQVVEEEPQVVAEETQTVEQEVREPAALAFVEEKQPVVVREVAPDVVRRGQILIRYNKSFTARLIQAEDDLRDYYDELKSELLSYKGVKSRISWKHETFRKGRVLVAKLKIRGKHISIYLPLNPADYIDTKYKVDDVSDKKTNADTPCAYAIKNDRRCRYAKELIATVMSAQELEKVESEPVAYSDEFPYDTTEHLINRELIKLVYSKIVENGEQTLQEVTEEEIQALMTEEEPIEDVVEEQPVQEEQVEDVVEEQQPDEPVEEEQAEEVVEEEVVEEEPVEEQPEEPVEEEVEEEPAEEPVEEEPVQAVTVEEAKVLMTDEEAKLSVEESTRYADKTKPGIINVDTLSNYFKAGEKVTLEEIRKRVPGYKKVTYIKVLARGTLDKPLTVEADDYSLDAVKMIALTGGTVIRTLKK